MQNKKFDRHIFKAGLLLAISCTLAASGCATIKNKKRPETPLFQPASSTEKDITLSIRNLGKDELLGKYKTVNNPYIAPPSLGGGNEIIVFELTVSSPLEIKLLLKDVEFHFGEHFVRPISGFHLAEYWDQRIQKQNAYRGWTSARVAQIIDRTMMPPRLTVKPNENYSGYVVFMGRFPSYGEAALYVPVYTKDNDLIHLFKL